MFIYPLQLPPFFLFQAFAKARSYFLRTIALFPGAGLQLWVKVLLPSFNLELHCRGQPLSYNRIQGLQVLPIFTDCFPRPPLLHLPSTSIFLQCKPWWEKQVISKSLSLLAIPQCYVSYIICTRTLYI